MNCVTGEIASCARLRQRLEGRERGIKHKGFFHVYFNHNIFHFFFFFCLGYPLLLLNLSDANEDRVAVFGKE